MISFFKKYSFNNISFNTHNNNFNFGYCFFSNSTLNDKKTSAIKENSILVINFSETKIVERKSENPFENLNPSSSDQKSMELKKILDNIEKAKNDKNIKAIYLNSPITSGGISQIRRN